LYMSTKANYDIRKHNKTQPAQEKKRGKHEKTSVTKRSKHQHNTD